MGGSSTFRLFGGLDVQIDVGTAGNWRERMIVWADADFSGPCTAVLEI